MTHKCLVVGGAGYVGRELCRQLLARGNEVVGLGRSSSIPEPKLKWIPADITQRAELESRLSGQQFDVIFHVASLPGDTGNPVQMAQVNLLGLTHLLEYARHTGTQRFVLTSSISAYEWCPATRFNPPNFLPVDENHPARPKDMYSSTKLMQEILAMTFFHQYGLPAVALRVTAVVGPGGRGGGRGWREFAEQLRAGKSVQIPHFSLDEVCHYVDLRDVARMHLAAADHPKAPGEIFNCCGPASVSGHQFVEIIQRHFPGLKVETGFPWSMAQGGQIAFDMSKAKRLLDFEPVFSLEDSIVAIKNWINAGGLLEERAVADKMFGAGIQQ